MKWKEEEAASAKALRQEGTGHVQRTEDASVGEHRGKVEHEERPDVGS